VPEGWAKQPICTASVVLSGREASATGASLFTAFCSQVKCNLCRHNLSTDRVGKLIVTQAVQKVPAACEPNESAPSHTLVAITKISVAYSSEQVRNTQLDGAHMDNLGERMLGLNLLRIMLCYFRHLSRSLGMLDAVFMSDRQQDATEFLVRLLDLFREHFSSSNSDLGLEGWYFLTH
jgi:hypothetical protein